MAFVDSRKIRPYPRRSARLLLPRTRAHRGDRLGLPEQTCATLISEPF
jgi:hypothetical protein